MAMPDAIDALLALMDAPVEKLTSLVYNVTAFNPSAEEFAELVRGAFPGDTITFAPDVRRQAIVDSWPGDVDDARARRDWGFARVRSRGARSPPTWCPTSRATMPGAERHGQEATRCMAT